MNAASSEDPAGLPSPALFKLIDTSCSPFDGLFSDAGFVSPAADRCSTRFICFLSKCEESAEDRCSRTLQQEEELGLDISISLKDGPMGHQRVCGPGSVWFGDEQVWSACSEHNTACLNPSLKASAFKKRPCGQSGKRPPGRLRRKRRTVLLRCSLRC